MKNKFTAILIIGLLANACTQKGNGPLEPNAKEIVISGKIENAPAEGLVVLEEISNENKSPYTPLDTFAIADDHTFSEEIVIPEPGYYRLNLYNRQFVNLILSDDNVLINADITKGPGTATIKGSDDTDLLMSINEIAKDFQLKMNELQQKFQIAQREDNLVQMEELRKQAERADEFKRRNVKDLLRKSPASIAAVYGVNYLNKEDDFPFLDSLATNLQQELPESKYIKDFVQGVEKLRATMVGQVAPEIALPNPEGETKRLSDLRGKIVLVDFWAAWCGPCRRENPNVVKMYNKYNGKGFEVFGVSLDRKKEDWVKAIAQDNLNWTQVSDLNYFDSEAAQTYGITAIPATVLLDKEGKIIARNLRGEELENKLEEIFNAN